MLNLFKQRLRNEPYGTVALVGRVLTEYGPSYWKRYVLSFAFMAVAAACTALSAYLIAYVTNNAYVHRNFAAAVTVCVVIFVLLAAKGLATYGQAIVLARIHNDITAQNQQRMFDKLLKQGLGYFDTHHSAELVARLSVAAPAAPSVLTLLITAIGRDTLTVIGLVTVMVLQDPIMSLIALVVMPLAILFVRDVVHRIRRAARSQFASNTNIFETMQETVRGFRTIKAFALEDRIRNRVFQQAEEFKRSANLIANLSQRSSPLMEALGGFAVALLFLYTSYRVVNMGATPGEFFAFMAAFLLAYQPLKRLAQLNVGLSTYINNVRLFYELVDVPEPEGEAADLPALHVGPGLIEFADVEFAYRDGEPVLRGMSFVAETGRVTALVGPSGGGKSTILSLILRLYDNSAGTIAVDGADIRRVSRKSLRHQIAYVGQDVFLFRGSIRDNIAFGSLGATENEIIAAACAAHAHEFIMSYPTGYDTSVGEHGHQLSAGQRQRVSIARALLKDAHIILLDEATAALDSESEGHVQEAIARLCEGRTTIVVAHRLQTIMHANRILFVEHGRVIEAGSHEELLRRGGRYASFHRLQFKGQSAKQNMTAG